MTLGRTQKPDASSFPPQSNEALGMKLQLTRATDALAELYQLLEKYAPTWYTPHHHQKAVSALRLVKRL